MLNDLLGITQQFSRIGNKGNPVIELHVGANFNALLNDLFLERLKYHSITDNFSQQSAKLVGKTSPGAG